MLFDPARHEARRDIPWDEARVAAAIGHIVADTEARYSPETWWPWHAHDLGPGDDPTQPATDLYFGAAGVIWALHYLQAVGAAHLARSYVGELERLRLRNHAALEVKGGTDFASYLAGETPILMQAYGRQPTAECAGQLADLIAGNIDHPARELARGAPGTLLAAHFLHERDTGDTRWADLFHATAAKLWSQLEWSDKYECHYWTQYLYGQHTNYIDAVHGFVATALPLIRGRDLLAPAEWDAWQQCIVNTVERTATCEDGMANWRPWLDTWEGRKAPMLVQYCHGAPGFIVCLAGMPGTALDALLLAAGEAIWAAGPLVKGSNLCHGTGGNGYALLKLYQRSGDARWLDRARAFAMHGIEQMQADAAKHGHLRYSLWTGDPGFAIYLWDCLRGGAAFPTLDVFWA